MVGSPPGTVSVAGLSLSTSTASTISPSQDFPNADLWEDARNQLSEDDKKTITQTLSTQELPPSSLNTPISETILEAVKAKREESKKSRWKVRIGKAEVELRGVADKVIVWLDKFKQVGDIAVSADPLHAGLPWAGIRFLLQAAVAGQEQTAALLSGLNRVLYVMYRCRLYELLFQPGQHKSSDQNLRLALGNFRTALLDLYKLVLHFLAVAMRVCQKNKFERTLAAFWSPSDILKFEEDCQATEDRAEKECQNCERYLQGQERTESSQYRTILNDLPQLKNLKSSIDHIDHIVTEVWETLQEDRICDILMWISKLPYQDHHQFACKNRTPGTGEWLIEDKTFRKWKSLDTSTILWLHGIPGAGKTKLVSRVIDHIKDNHPDYGLAYFYCKRDDDHRRDPENILRSFVKQLSKFPRKNSLHQVVVKAHQEYRFTGGASAKLSFNQSKEILSQLTHDYSKFVMVLDALDECYEESRGDLIDVFNWLVTQSDNVKIFVASRRDDDIKWQLERKSNIGIGATHNQGDIERFVNERIENAQKTRRKPISRELKQDIITTLYEKSGGMFQWAALQIEQILGLALEIDIRKRLGQLPKGLKAAYDEIFSKIQAAEGSNPDIAHQAFEWILHSPVPLDALVLPDLISRSLSGGTNLVLDLDIDIILDACCNLLVVDQYKVSFGVEGRSLEFRFAHLSVQEYIEEHTDGGNALSVPQPAHSKHAVATLGFLSELSGLFERWDSDIPKHTGVRSPDIPPALKYATVSWPFYAKRALEKPTSEQLEHILFDFFSLTNTKVRDSWLRAVSLLKQYRHCPEYIRQIMPVVGNDISPSALYCAAALGMESIVAKLLSEGARVASDKSAESPIIAAARYGCPKTVSRLLYSYSANPISVIYQSMRATTENAVEVMLVLLRHGLGYQNSDDNSFQSLCFLAATESRGGDPVMHLLLREFPGFSMTESILQAVVTSRFLSESMIGALLDQNVTLTITENTIQRLVSRRRFNLIALVLEKRPEMPITEATLRVATQVTWVAQLVVNILLEKRPETPITEEVFNAAMRNPSCASSLVQLFLERRPDIAITETTLEAAATAMRRGRPLMSLLLEKRPDLPITESTVEAAARNTRCGDSLIALLLEKRPDLPITEATVEAAASNTRCGDSLIALLLEKRPNLHISEATVEAVAKNRREREKERENALRQLNEGHSYLSRRLYIRSQDRGRNERTNGR